MKIKGTILLLLTACAATWLFAGCDNSHVRIKGDSYDKSVSSLSLDNKGLNNKDIAPLQNMTDLVSLFLSDNDLSDLAPLTNLMNLTTLHLNANQIGDLTPLTNLTNLTALYLSGNQISDLTPLTNLTNLAALFLSANQISDLTPLSSLSNLTTLFLTENQITDLTPLASLAKLDFLHVLNNKIADWSPAAHIPNVEGRPDNAVLLTEAANRLKIGHFYYVSFDETQSIPMRWRPSISDESLIRLICTEVNKGGVTSNLPGAGGEKRIFYFEALHTGACTIEMALQSITGDQTFQTHSYNFSIEE